jgi:hypothetical protein
VDLVEFEPDINSVEADGLVVRVQPQRKRDTGREPSEQEFIGCWPGIGAAREARFIPTPCKLASLYLDRVTVAELGRDCRHLASSPGLCSQRVSTRAASSQPG